MRVSAGAGRNEPFPIRPYSIAVTRVEGEWLGRTLEAEGKRTEAIAQYREALRLDPKRKFAHERLSKLEKSPD